MPLKRTSRGGLLFSEKIVDAVNIGATTDNNTDVDVSSMDEIIVDARMTTATAGDLVISVRPYEPDGTTLFPGPLPTVAAVAPAIIGAESVGHSRFDVTAYEKVQVRIRNGSASPHVTHAMVRSSTTDALP